MTARSFAAAALIACSTSAAAQPSIMARGRAVVAGTKTERPLAGAWVTLHRVAADSAAPVDSQRTDAAGRFAIAIRATRDSSAAYIATVLHQGIVYYSDAMAPADAGRTALDVTAFDTSSSARVSVESRHVVVSAPGDDGLRRVIEVFMLSNAGPMTRIATLTSPSFSTPLPSGAIDPKPTDGDASDAAMAFSASRASIAVPIAPGTKRISFTYQLPVRSAVDLAMGDSTELLEVLAEDSAATVAGAGVKSEAPTTLSGRTFRRFTGEHLAPGATVHIVAPSGIDPVLGAPALVAIAIGVGFGTLLALALRGAARAGRELAPPEGAT